MDAKEFLRQARVLKHDIDRKHDQLLRLQSMAQRVTGSCEALRVDGTGSHSKLEDSVARLVDIEDALSRDVALYAEKYQQIAGVIDAVENPNYRRLLSLRYLSFKTWEEIAVDMKYSYRHVMRTHRSALYEVSLPKDVLVCHY